MCPRILRWFYGYTVPTKPLFPQAPRNSKNTLGLRSFQLSPQQPLGRARRYENFARIMVLRKQLCQAECSRKVPDPGTTKKIMSRLLAAFRRGAIPPKPTPPPLPPAGMCGHAPDFQL